MPSDPAIPDLASLIAEKASRATSSVTVPLSQGLREQIIELDRQIADLGDGKPTRMGAASPKKRLVEERDEKAAQMRASEITLRFEALTEPQRAGIRIAMGGRDDPDELNLRATAAMVWKIEGPDGTYFERADGQSIVGTAPEWSDLVALRDKLGAHLYDITIDAAASRASGGDWSVPFSWPASPTSET